MPWKLVLFVIVLVLITVFAGFNLDNKCSISFVFKTVENVSVFMSLMFAFLAGMVIMIPFTIKKRSKNSKSDKKKNKDTATVPADVNYPVSTVVEYTPVNGNAASISTKQKKSLFGKKKTEPVVTNVSGVSPVVSEVIPMGAPTETKKTSDNPASNEADTGSAI